MKIKSIIDVITNSSSECFQIKNTLKLTEDEFREKWDKEIKDLGYFNESGNCIYGEYLDYTVRGEIYSEGEYLYLDYPVMCNIDQDIKEILENWFGKGNVYEN
jgi:hypothetical protein